MSRSWISRAISAVAVAAVASGALWPTMAAAQTDPEVSVERDIVYATHGDVSLALDAYLPAGDGPHPAVVWIHGGKWVKGDKAGTEDLEISATLAAAGFAAFSVNYRLASPDAGAYPQAVDDVADAVGFVRRNADRFGVDPDRIALAGESSGGQLAALVATRDEGALTEGSRVAAVVSFSGLFDLAPLLHDENPNLVRAVSMFLGCSPDSPACEDRAAEASPVVHVDPSDPPFFITNADEEVIPLGQAETMRAALEDAGLRAKLIVPHTTIHGLNYVSHLKIFGPTAMTIPEMYLGFLGEELDHDVQFAGPPAAAPPAAATPTPSSKTAPEEGVAPVVPGNVEKEDSGDDGWLLALTVVALIVAVTAIGATLLMLRVRRTRPTPPAPKRQDNERARVDTGSRSG